MSAAKWQKTTTARILLRRVSDRYPQKTQRDGFARSTVHPVAAGQEEDDDDLLVFYYGVTKKTQCRVSTRRTFPPVPAGQQEDDRERKKDSERGRKLLRDPLARIYDGSDSYRHKTQDPKPKTRYRGVARMLRAGVRSISLLPESNWGVEFLGTRRRDEDGTRTRCGDRLRAILFRKLR